MEGRREPADPRGSGLPDGQAQLVDALFGSYTSGVQLAMNPTAEKYQVPCIAC